jgi:hypothetical protein
VLKIVGRSPIWQRALWISLVAMGHWPGRACVVALGHVLEYSPNGQGLNEILFLFPGIFELIQT